MSTDFIKNKKPEYSFTSYITGKVTKEEVRQENGSEVIVKKEVEEKIPVSIYFYKPTRRQREEADLVYSKKMFSLMEEGIMTKQQIAKVYNNGGGDLSKPEVDLYVKLTTELSTKLRDAEYLNRKDPSTWTEEEKIKNVSVITDISLIKRELIEFETQRAAIFEHCADQKAFYHVLSWYVVNLTFKQIGDKIEPLFVGKTFEEKLDNYDELIEKDDELISNIRHKLNSLVAYWYSAGPKEKKDWLPIEEELGITPEAEKS
jgi:hypothetical protein